MTPRGALRSLGADFSSLEYPSREQFRIDMLLYQSLRFVSLYIVAHAENRVGGFRPLTHHRTCLLWHTAVLRHGIGPETLVPAATLYLSSADTLTTPPHCHVDSDLHRLPSLSRGFVHFSTSWLCCYMF